MNCTPRFKKRGAISMVEMTPIYLSLLAEVTARIVALGTFFSEVPRFEVWFPVMFLIHFSLVLAMKLRWEKEYWDRQEMGAAKTTLAATASAAASFLVYVKMQPSRDKLRGRPPGGGDGPSTADEVVLMAKKEHSKSREVKHLA